MTDLAPMTPHQLSKLPKYAQDPNRPYKGEPWEKQLGETGRAFMAFQIYRDMDRDKRTLTATYVKLCEETGTKVSRNKKGEINYSTVSRWKKWNRWEERLEAYESFMDAKMVAVHRRERIRAATKHAQQAAEVQDLLTLPLKKLRDRIAANGDEFGWIDGLSDEQLMKLSKVFAADLPTFQKAERDALASTSETVVASREIRAKGEIVRKMLQDDTIRGLMETVSFEVTETEHQSEAG